ncbi:MAG: sensor histidine kinase [Chloroflexota bacterium]
MRDASRSAGSLEENARRCLNDLAILHLLDVERCYAELAEGLKQAGVKCDEASLCAALRRLERRRVVRKGQETCGGRRRRCYCITEEGRRIRATVRDLWVSQLDLLNALASVPEAVLNERPDASSLESERAALLAERQNLDRLRNDLLSTISHELRTPLTLVRTSIGLLLDTKPDPAMRDRLLRNIKQSTDRMHVLVTDLLDLVRLRSGHAELSLRRLDVNELVTEAATLMRPLLDEKRQTLDLDLPTPAPIVMGDHRRLEQVLLNLLSNANKFAPQLAQVRISVVDDGAWVTVGVSDNGPGISPDEQLHLFEQFYTARTSSPSHNIGVGLGLPIAKGIVEAHGGNMWVKSEVGAGTTVYFALCKDGPGRGGLGEDTGC